MMQNTQILGNKAKSARLAGPCDRKMTSGRVSLALALGLSALALLSGSLAACGQKGPLYLPAPANAASTPTSSTSK
ncbi:lipoprotein [Aquabacterium sp.]|uniref:LPS translocon maturation chaperone LptM n=1 Tax=Aquabacterium sp. TaxID=1872578 RepID=UPI00345B6D2A